VQLGAIDGAVEAEDLAEGCRLRGGRNSLRERATGDREAAEQQGDGETTLV